MAAAPASDWEDGRYFMEDLIQQGQGMLGGEHRREGMDGQGEVGAAPSTGRWAPALAGSVGSCPVL